MSEITRLLQPENGDSPDMDAVFERLYPELKQLAKSRLHRHDPGTTLTPTALVNEAYMKLVQASRLDLKSRQHFFSCAARAMRHIIIDAVRSRLSDKRGGRLASITLHDEQPALIETPQRLLELDCALDELDRMSPRQRRLVELKFFAGLPIREIAELLEMPTRTAWREWQRARAFLHARLNPAPLDPAP